jgi:hypothetical protein
MQPVAEIMVNREERLVQVKNCCNINILHYFTVFYNILQLQVLGFAGVEEARGRTS